MHKIQQLLYLLELVKKQSELVRKGSEDLVHEADRAFKNFTNNAHNTRGFIDNDPFTDEFESFILSILNSLQTAVSHLKPKSQP
jgi:hypothetical protein